MLAKSSRNHCVNVAVPKSVPRNSTLANHPARRYKTYSQLVRETTQDVGIFGSRQFHELVVAEEHKEKMEKRSCRVSTAGMIWCAGVAAPLVSDRARELANTLLGISYDTYPFLFASTLIAAPFVLLVTSAAYDARLKVQKKYDALRERMDILPILKRLPVEKS
jgi:hypothetical protein